MNRPASLPKRLPDNVTSYDLLKTFAVIFMIVDHVGYYFYPEEMWFRALGRLCVPVWFFLIGYAKGRDLSKKLWGGAIILLVANALTGMAVFPMNVLATIIAIRLVIDYVADFCLKSKLHLYGCLALLIVLVFPSNIITEYGTLALMTALYGYFVRHKKEINNDPFIFGYMVFSFTVFVVFQQLFAGFTVNQFAFMAAGTLVVRMGLFYFDLYEYPFLTRVAPRSVVLFLQFCGRYTLEIYVVHLIVFKLTALFLGYEDFGLFDFRLFPEF